MSAARSERVSAVSAFGILWRAALLGLGLVAFLPTHTTSLGPNPKPISGYETAIQMAQAVQRADSAAAPGGASIVLTHGHRTPRAFVFFHGLTNSPSEYRQLARAVYDAGDNVFVPRLPWHALRGGTSSDLRRMTADALRDVAENAVTIATGLGDTVVVFGFSLGGNAAAWVAQFRAVGRAVIAAPALGLSHLSTTVQTPAMNMMLRLPDYSKPEPPDTLRPDRALGWSSRGVGEMLKLGTAVRRAADDHAPLAGDIRVLANANDHTVNRDAIDELVAHWSARGARVAMYELSDTLHLPHDFVDPDEETGRTTITDPVILELVRGVTPTPSQGVRVISLDTLRAHH